MFMALLKFMLSYKTPGAPFTNMVLTLIPTWISEYIHYTVWAEITVMDK